MSGLNPEDYLRRIAADVPLVVVGRAIARLEGQCLRVDDRHSAYEATRYLIGLGHRRIAHIAGPEFHQDALDRHAGYSQALSDAGLALDPQLIVEGDYTEHSGLLTTQALLSRAALFTAIFAANDQMAYGARLALYRHGIRVPDDVSLVEFDDQLASSYTTPPLTTVRVPTLEMGRMAAQGVLGLLDKQRLALPTVATELVIRESAALRR